MRVQRFLVSAVVLCAVLTAYAQAPETPPSPLRTLQPVKNFVTVTDQTIRSPKAEDWVFYRGNYQAWGWSALNEKRSRAVPSGTVGGRIATARKPSCSRSREAARAASALPTISGNSARAST